MITASEPDARVRVTPTVSVTSQQACWTALVTSSDVTVAASSAKRSRSWRLSAARTWNRAIRTDSGLAGSMKAMSRGSIRATAPAASASRSGDAALSLYASPALALM
jgi:hypothetical protein